MYWPHTINSYTLNTVQRSLSYCRTCITSLIVALLFVDCSYFQNEHKFCTPSVPLSYSSIILISFSLNVLHLSALVLPSCMISKNNLVFCDRRCYVAFQTWHTVFIITYLLILIQHTHPHKIVQIHQSSHSTGPLHTNKLANLPTYPVNPYTLPRPSLPITLLSSKLFHTIDMLTFQLARVPIPSREIGVILLYCILNISYYIMR